VVTKGKHSRDTDGDLRATAGDLAESSGGAVLGNSMAVPSLDVGASTLFVTSVELERNESMTSCWAGICGLMDDDLRSEIPTF
jgi:hypothetical protein